MKNSFFQLRFLSKVLLWNLTFSFYFKLEEISTACLVSFCSVSHAGSNEHTRPYRIWFQLALFLEIQKKRRHHSPALPGAVTDERNKIWKTQIFVHFRRAQLWLKLTIFICWNARDVNGQSCADMEVRYDPFSFLVSPQPQKTLRRSPQMQVSEYQKLELLFVL